MNDQTQEIFFRERRRGEATVRITWPVMYYFIHSVERADTKQFRRAEAIGLSRFGLALKVNVVDPAILATIEQSSQIFVRIRLDYGDGQPLDAVGRVTRVLNGLEPNAYTFGVEYTEADAEARDACFAAAMQQGELIPGEAS